MSEEKAPKWFSDMLGAVLEGCVDGIEIHTEACPDVPLEDVLPSPLSECIFRGDEDPRAPGIEDVILCEECTQKLGRAIVLVESGLAEGVNIMSCNWGEDGETAHAPPGD